jgi:hypothetical protein
MESWLLLAGLGLGLAGALVVAMADAWLSRSLLNYLDDVECNVAKLAEAIRAGNAHVAITDIDLKRDRGQNQARGLKSAGWLALALGLGLQFAAACLRRLS